MSLTKSLVAAATAAVIVLQLGSSLRAADAPGAGADEQKLIATLGSDAPLFEKAKACQKLAVAGTKAAVPALAALLASEELSHYARFGLEPIPDPSVDAAFRDAMGKLQGKLLVGVINSIGVRRDAAATDALTKLLAGEDRDVAAAAASALGRIGTPGSAAILRRALGALGEPTRSAVAGACLPCAEQLLAAGKADEAVKLYDAARAADVPEHLRLAATRGAILARGEGGVGLLTEVLAADAPAMFALGLRAGRELKAPAATRAMMELVRKVPAERGALVISALGDRGDPEALPMVLAALKDPSEDIRASAARALKNLGNASAVPVLAEAAAGSDADAAKAARETLAAMEGPEIDAAIVRLLEKGGAGQRAVLIELVGKRRIASAIPELRRSVRDDDETIRRATIAAMGTAAGLEDLPILIGELLSPKAEADRDAVREALKTACRRVPDRDACAEKLLASVGQAPAGGKALLIDIFSAVGGAKALDAITAMAKGADDGVRAAAVRALGDWPTEDAAATLLGLVKASSETRDRIQAYRALSTIVQRLGFPTKEQRLAVCTEAMGLAKDDAERTAVLEALGGIPAPETLQILTPYLDDAGLKEAASAAVVKIGERLVRARPNAVVQPIRKVLETTKDPKLVARAEKVLAQAGGRR